jgi:hypothetical protein
MRRYILALLFIATTCALFNSCQKEVSFENSDTPSVGLLQSDISGVCAPMTVNGIYEAGTVLVAADNYIDVEVDVATLGSYTIYSDTLNGVYFRATGNFTAIGLNTIRLPGTGTPNADGTFTYTITYGLSECTVDVAVLPDGGAIPAEFELDGDPGTCLGYNLLGAYTTGVALTSANKVEISVDVTTIGTYDITTTASNGITFSGSGVLPALGPTTITLTATGTPTVSGPTNVLVTDGTTTCSFQVDVTGPAVFTMNCGAITVNGAYTQGQPASSVTYNIEVNVASIGTYTITGSVNGITVTKSASFTSTGVQVVTITATGTPTTAGSFTLTLNGATAPCTQAISVAPPVGGAASYAVQCGSAVPHGTFTQNVALTAANTVDVPVNVTAVGSYTITATGGGMSFTKTGTFAATGATTVILNPSGTPTGSGAVTIPVTGGTPTCSISITVTPAGPTAAVYTVDCTSADVQGFYTEGVALTAANIVDIDVNVATPGTYTITGTINGMIFTKTGTFATAGTQTITLTSTGIPTADGDFNVPLTGGTAGCSFEVTVFPNIGTWRFNVGATLRQGTIVDGGFDPGNPFPAPTTLFFGIGTNGPQDIFLLEFVDLNGAMLAGETYVMQFPAPPPPITVNFANFVFQSGTTATEYNADPINNPTNMVITVTSHNTTTKLITGTFTGNALDENGATVAITNGQFSFTYP